MNLRATKWSSSHSEGIRESVCNGLKPEKWLEMQDRREAYPTIHQKWWRRDIPIRFIQLLEQDVTTSLCGVPVWQQMVLLPVGATGYPMPSSWWQSLSYGILTRNMIRLDHRGWMLGSWKYTLPETNSSHLKMDGWNTNFLLGRPIFQGRTVSFTEGVCIFFGCFQWFQFGGWSPFIKFWLWEKKALESSCEKYIDPDQKEV